jgi:hypothetical protein
VLLETADPLLSSPGPDPESPMSILRPQTLFISVHVKVSLVQLFGLKDYVHFSSPFSRQLLNRRSVLNQRVFRHRARSHWSDWAACWATEEDFGFDFQNGRCTAMWKANRKTTTLSLFLDSLFPETEIPCMRDAWRLERILSFEGESFRSH